MRCLSFPPSAFSKAQAAPCSPDYARPEAGGRWGPGGNSQGRRINVPPSHPLLGRSGSTLYMFLPGSPAGLIAVSHRGNAIHNVPFIGSFSFLTFPTLCFYVQDHISHLSLCFQRVSGRVTCPEVTTLTISGEGPGRREVYVCVGVHTGLMFYVCVYFFKTFFQMLVMATLK